MARVISRKSVQDWEQEGRRLSKKLRASFLRSARWRLRLCRFLERMHSHMAQSIQETFVPRDVLSDRTYSEFRRSFELLDVQICSLLKRSVGSSVVAPKPIAYPEGPIEDKWQDYVDDIKEMIGDYTRQLDWRYRTHLLSLVELMDTVERITHLTFPMPVPEDETSYGALAQLKLKTRELGRSLRSSLSARSVKKMDLRVGDYPPIETTRIVSDKAGGADGKVIIAEILETGYLWKGQVLRKTAVIVEAQKEDP